MKRRVKTRGVVRVIDEFPALLFPSDIGRQLGPGDIREIPVRAKMFGDQFYLVLLNYTEDDGFWEPGDPPTGWILYLIKNLLVSFDFHLDDEVDVEMVVMEHRKHKRGRRIYKPGEYARPHSSKRGGISTWPEPADTEVFEPWARAMAKDPKAPYAKRLARDVKAAATAAEKKKKAAAQARAAAKKKKAGSKR